MIESGSLTPGIDSAAFGLPAGTALRYEQPAAALRGLVPSYAVLDSDPAVWTGPGSWVLPGWPQIWIVLTSGRITVAVRRGRPAPLGAAMVFGGSSRAMPVTSHGGVTVVIDLSPMGWARLFDVPAAHACDQMLPLGQLMTDATAEALIATLHASGRAGQVKALLDDFLQHHMAEPSRHEAIIARIHEAVRSDAPGSGGDIAAATGIDQRTLRDFSGRYFCYPPTVLKRRTRFLRSLAAMMLARDAPTFSTPPPGYHDATHFIRDGNDFLGTTPRRFMAMPMPYLRAAMRARAMVLGEPLPLLDRFADG